MKLNYAIIATLFAAGAAVAAEAPDFSAIDKDRSGAVSREEARAVPAILEVFARVDSNQDGQLNTVEYAEAVKLLS
jgi:Ca2+-binding EF-hand superfamily protein